MTYAFKSIDWGQDFAKGDVKLKDYFVHFPEFEEVQDKADPAGKVKWNLSQEEQ